SVRPNVRAVASDAEWNITHQINLLRLRVGLDVLPLRESNPLNVSKEELLSAQLITSLLGQRQHPSPRTTRAAVLGLPAIPGGGASIRLHQDAKQRVVGEPVGVLHEECAELRGTIGFFVEVLFQETRESGFKQFALEGFDLWIIHRASADLREQ